MPANLSHFAINADDVTASRAFYEQVFGWTFNAWGPPDFFQIQTGTDDEPGLRGALQKRRELAAGVVTVGMEPTFGVDDIEATLQAARDAGATILMEPFTIAGVGHLIFFADPSGNPIGAMQYDSNAQ